MKRLTLATMTALLAVPAAALAASGNGVVLSVNARHRTIEVVDAHHVVHAYHYRGRLPKLHAGSRISFAGSNASIQRVRVNGTGSGTVSFLGKVVRSNKRGLVVRLADGKTVSFTAEQVRRSRSRTPTKVSAATDASVASVTINISGLAPGITVLIAETVDGRGNISISIAFPDGATLTAEQHASGTITEVDFDAFLLSTDDGSVLRLHMAPDALNNLNLPVCDTADVTYHQDAGMLIGDAVKDTGTSDSPGCSAGGELQGELGMITAVSTDGLTISTEDQGSMRFVVDSPDITDGFHVGDVVDVTYADNGDGTHDAGEVEYVEQDVTGTVTAVRGGSMTITSDDSGAQLTLTADPSQGLFAGVAVGDQVDINYHQSGSLLVVDSVEDQS
jgi:hypothetical protein